MINSKHKNIKHLKHEIFLNKTMQIKLQYDFTQIIVNLLFNDFYFIESDELINFCNLILRNLLKQKNRENLILSV